MFKPPTYIIFHKYLLYISIIICLFYSRRSIQNQRNRQEKIWCVCTVLVTFPIRTCYASISTAYTYKSDRFHALSVTILPACLAHWDCTHDRTLVINLSSVKSVATRRPTIILWESIRCGTLARQDMHAHFAPIRVYKLHHTKNTWKPNIQVRLRLYYIMYFYDLINSYYIIYKDFLILFEICVYILILDPKYSIRIFWPSQINWTVFIFILSVILTLLLYKKNWKLHTSSVSHYLYFVHLWLSFNFRYQCDAK